MSMRFKWEGASISIRSSCHEYYFPAVGVGVRGKAGEGSVMEGWGSSCQAIPAPLSALFSLLKGLVARQGAMSLFPVKDILASLGSNLSKLSIR